MGVSVPAKMRVMWKENPMLSSLRTSRVLSQFSALTRRSVLRASSSVRTIIAAPVTRARPGLNGGWAGAPETPRCRNLRGLAYAALAQHLVDAACQDVQAPIQLRLGDGQRAQALHYLGIGAAGLDDHAQLKGLGSHLAGQLGLGKAQALHHAAPLGLQAIATMVVGNAAQPLAQLLAPGLDLQSEAIVLPVLLQCGPGGDEGVVVAAEGAVVLTRLPLVILRPDQGDCQGQAKPGQRLGQGDHIGLDPRRFEAEESAVTATSILVAINNQQHVVLAAHLFQAL